MNLTVVKSLILKILETSEKLKGYRATVYGNCYVTNIIALFEGTKSLFIHDSYTVIVQRYCYEDFTGGRC